MAAGQSGGEKQRLPGVLDLFMEWCEETRKDFELGPQIEEALYSTAQIQNGDDADLRGMASELPARSSGTGRRGLQRRPTEGETDTLRLEMKAVPGWTPGRSMKTPNPAVKVAVIPK